MENKLFAFQPTYAVHPGEYVQELLETYGMRQTELAIRLGITTKHLNNLINGKVPITFELANALEKVFVDHPARYWLSLQTTYDLLLRNIQIAEQYKKDPQVYDEWLNQFDYTNLVKMGYVKEFDSAKTTVARINNLLTFFGCSDMESWNNLYCSDLPASCRIAGASAAKVGNTSAWIRVGQILAQGYMQYVPEYNRSKFKEVLIQIRKLTIDTSKGFSERMRKLCQEAGVILMFVKEIPRSGICGAAYWINCNSIPCIQMSLRFKKNDHFWFTFFHEAAHIIKEHKKVVFLDCDEIDNTDAENEADRLSRDFLIPPPAYSRFIRQGRFYKEDIINFANYLEIHPGIVVGRLQHDNKIEWSWHNSLKTTLEWSS